MGRREVQRRRFGRPTASGALVLLLLLAAALAVPSGGSDAQSLGSGEIRIVGMAVDVDTRPDVDGLQATMSAVKDIPTGALAFVGQPGAGFLPPLPAGSLVKAEISGPSFPEGPVTVSGVPNQLMPFPPLRVAGDHYLTNVRLEDETGALVLERDPARPPIVIDVLGELLVTEVTSRQLTLEEIQEKGIVIDEDNFTAFNFTVGLTLGSENVVIDLPVVIPNTAEAAASVEAPRFMSPRFEPQEFAKIDIPNFSLAGFRLLPPPELKEKEIQLPEVNGVIVIPGNIAFLNQFFSVVLQATNVAPEGSGLVLDDARARIVLPGGEDGNVGSGDDPLRVAETSQGGVQEVLPLVDAAGVASIPPQATNQAEFLVEGLREGTHTVDFEIKGDLFVPSLGESFELMGMAQGVVQVKNPSFSLVLAHPDVVREDEEYSLFTTVTNTSTSVANLFKLELSARALSGARLAPGQEAVRTLETLLPGESASFEYRLVATATGEVGGTVFLADEGINGSFVLFTGVGDTGIPLSPDTLVLPQTVDYLPDDPEVVRAAVRLLGQAYSVATAPAGALPPEVARMSRAHVFDRAVKVAQAGLHVRFGEEPVLAAQDILLDYLGNDLQRLDVLLPDDEAARERAARDLRAFDALRRTTGAGANFSDVLGALLGESLAETTVSGLIGQWATTFASRPEFLLAGVSSRGPPVFTQLSDGDGFRLGRLAGTDEVAREIPTGALLPLSDPGADSEEVLAVAAPTSDLYLLELTAPEGAADVELSLVLRGESGPLRVTWPRLDLAPGGYAVVTVVPGESNAFVLEVDADGDGVSDDTLTPLFEDAIEDAPPGLFGVFQWGKGARPNVSPGFAQGDPIGRLVGVLFSEEVSRDTAETLTRYDVSGNPAVAASLQPDRRLAFVVLEKPVGPFIERSLSVGGIADLRGNAMGRIEEPIGPDPDRGAGGIVRGQVVTAQGAPVPFAPVDYVQPLFVPGLFEDCAEDFIISGYQTDAEGRFEIEFVLQNGWPSQKVCTPDTFLSETGVGGTHNFKLAATDPETGETGTASTRIQFDGQELEVTVIIRGFGAIEGFVYDEQGNRVVGGEPYELAIFARNLSTGERLRSWVDADGRYGFPAAFEAADGSVIEAESVPVGNVALTVAQVVSATEARTGVVTTNIPAAGVTVQQDIVLVDALRFGTVSGRVLEGDGVTPAANVRVQVAAEVLTSVSATGSQRQKGVVASGFTDDDGAFSFDDIPSGEVEILATRQATFEQARAKSTLAPGGEESLLLVFPGGGGTLSGCVNDALGNAVAGATIAVGPTLTRADERGCFEAKGLPRGTFTVYAQGTESPSLGTATFTTTGPDDAQAVVVTLEPVGSIEGTVFEADGLTRKVGQKVQLWLEPNKGVLAEAFTDAEGRFRFRNYPVGSYSVRAIDRLTDDGGMVNTDIRFAGDTRVANLRFRGLGVIEGTVVQAGDAPRTPVIADVVIMRKVWKIVTDSGVSGLRQDLALEALGQFAQIEGLEGAVERTIQENNLGGAAPEFFFLLDEPVLVKSDLLGPGGEVTGRFRFEGPTAAGPFTVSALSTFLRPAVVRDAIPNTTVPEERAVDVGEIVLDSATSNVRGTVFLPDGETPLTYEPDPNDPGACEGAEVTIRSLGDGGTVLVPGVGQVGNDTAPEQSVRSCPDGTFEFPLVLAGRFTLGVDTLVPTRPAPSTAAEIETEVPEDLNVRLYGRASGSAPAGDEFVTVDLRLADAAAVKVNVVDSDGSPVEQARVSLSTASSLDESFDEANTDAAGEVGFLPVIEGGFSVAVRLQGDPRRGYASGAIPQNPPPGFEQAVTVQLGAITTSTGEVVEAAVFGGVEGTVFKADGSPLENPAEVTVKASGATLLTATHPDGTYSIENVPAGFFSVEVFEPFTARRGSSTGRVTEEEPPVVVDVTLVGLGTVNGEVFDADGSEMLGGVDVMLLPSGSFSDKLVSRSSPEDGSYSFPGVPLGPYTVMATDPVSALTGESRDFIELDGQTKTTNVFLEPAGEILGLVFAAGVLDPVTGDPDVIALEAELADLAALSQDRPLDASESARVDEILDALRAIGGALEPAEVAIEKGGFSEPSDASDGTFASTMFLTAGSYELTARPKGGGTGPPPDGATGRAEIRFDGQRSLAILQLAGLGIVEGVVLDSLGVDPVPNAAVTLSSASPFSAGAITRITDADGRFRFAGGAGNDDPLVPVGEFSIGVRVTIDGVELGASVRSEVEAHDETVLLEGPDAVLLQPSGTVRGSVLLADEITPADGAIALLQGLAGRAGIRVVRLAGIDTLGDDPPAPGEFFFGGIPAPGSYRLSVEEPDTGGVAQRLVSLDANGQVVAYLEGALGPIVLDPDAPSVVGTDPGDDATGVRPAADISLAFSEPIAPDSLVAGQSVEIRAAGEPVPGSFAVDGANAVFTPDATLPDLSVVTVDLYGDALGFEGQVLTPGVRDPSGNDLTPDFSFSFTTGDSAPPELLSLSPARDAVEVNPASVIRIEFDEPVDPASVSGFSLVRTLDGEAVAGRLNDQPVLGGRVLVFVPDLPLTANREYVATLGGPIADRVGNAIAEDPISWRFETVDTDPPVIETLSLAAGSVLRQGSVVEATAAVGAASDDTVGVEFYVDGALVATEAVAPYAFGLALAPAFGTQVVLAAVAIDEAGNRSPPVELPIAIGLNGPPTVAITAPTGGAVSQGATVNVSVAASDDVGVASVSFTAEAGALGSGTDTSAPYAFSFTVPADAEAGSTVELLARATDGLGAGAVSAPVLLTVVDELDPSVTIGSPGNGQILAAGTGQVDVLVTARDGSGIAQIRLEGSGLASFDETRAIDPAASPAAASFTVPLPAGAPPETVLTLTATALDGIGRGGSDQITVRLSDATPPSVTAELLDPADGTAEPGDTVRIRAEASDNVGVRTLILRAEGLSPQTRTLVPTPDTTQTFTFALPARAVGEALAIEVEARDEDGNVGFADPLGVTVVDETAPSLTIVAPTAGAKFAPGASIAVQLSAADAEGVASITCAASGADEAAPVVISVDPPAASVDRVCSFTVPADAAEGAVVQVTATARDAAGNTSNPAVGGFTVADTTAPGIVEILPADGAAGVAPDAVVSVRFDEPVDAGSFAAAFRLEGPGGAVAGALASSEGGAVQTFTPAAELTPLETYTVTVGTAVQDLEGNALPATVSSSFTVSADQVGPCLLPASLAPADGASGQPLSLALRASFDEPLDRTTVTTDSVSLVRDADDAPVSFSLALENGDQTVVLQTEERLALASAYRVDWTPQIQDLSGNALRSAGECAGGAPPAEPPPVAASNGFSTGTIAIAAPLAGQDVIEGQDLALRAGATAALGVVGLDWSDDLGAVGTGAPPDFEVSTVVPGLAALGGATLTISAEADLGDGLDPVAVDPVTVNVLSADVDSDGDGLSNGDEIAQGSDPFSSDRPEVTSVTPPDGASGVGIDTTVVVAFSQALDPATLSATSVVLEERGGAEQSAARTLSVDGRTLTLTPGAALGLARVYDLTVTTAVRGDTGAALAEVFTSSFATGDFGIATPGDGSSVPESSELVIEAVANAALLVSEVVFTVNGEELAPVAGTTSFQATYSVPSASEVASLVIVASARDSGGTEIASDQVTVDVGVRLAFVPKLVGLPVGGSTDLRLTVSSPRSSDLTVDLASVDPAVVAVPALVVLPAGESGVDVPVQAAAACPIDPATALPKPTCATSVIASTPTGAAGAVVSVSESDVGACQAGVARNDTDCQVLAPTAGVGVRRTQLVARLALAPGSSATLEVPVLRAPAAGATPVTVTSSDASVASGLDTIVAAGETTVALEIQAAAGPGNAFLQLRTNDELVVVEVAVGQAPSGATALAAPAGVAMRSTRLIGRLALTPEGAATLAIPLLTTPAAAATPVTVTSTEPDLVSAPNTEVPAGETAATLEIQTGAGPGSAILRLTVDGESVSLEIAVGQAPSGATALAVPAGVAVRSTHLAARLALAPDAAATLVVPLLAAPAAVDTPVTVTSSDAALASAVDTVILAGQTAASLALQAGSGGGTARLKLIFAGQVVSVEVSVGGAPSGAAAIAQPAGVSALQAGNAGTLYLPAGTSRTVTAPLRTNQKAALLGAVGVDAASRDAAIADVSPGSFVLAAGESSAEVTITAVADGETVIFFQVGPDDVRTLRVIVGVPAAGKEPFSWAAPAGACVPSSEDCP